jgi:hypothetical protein
MSRTVAWLIERNEKENQRPTMWWVTDHIFTEDANKAMKFSTKEEAEAICPPCLAMNRHHATEHVFLDQPPASVADTPTREALARIIADTINLDEAAHNMREADDGEHADSDPDLCPECLRVADAVLGLLALPSPEPKS